jgi:cellulose synthase/poly-beta-1,6-N-acetylglucosamine synthase-like glycosyltransferase
VSMFEISNILVYILLFGALYFEVFLLIVFLENRKQHTQAAHTSFARLPSVSIIVPCYNEEHTVEKTIHSLLNLNYPKHKIKIIAVNDGSTDNTAHILDRFSNHPQVTTLHKENGGKHTALNFALLHVSSELVGCLDADSFVHTDALIHIVPHFNDDTIKAVTPAIKVYRPNNLLQYIQKAEYEMSIFIRKVFSHIDSVLVTPGPFSIFRTDVFRVIGNYRHAYNTEDLEIALRLHKHHFKIGNAHTALVYTTTPATIRSLCRQRIRWTYGFMKNSLEYRSLYFKKEYGHFGMFILPFTALSIFSALFFAGFFLVNMIRGLMTIFVELQAVGLGLVGRFQFDLFFINTESMLFLVYVIVLITLLLLAIGKRLGAERRYWSFDMFYYLFLYGFLAPLWLGAAVYNLTFAKETSWAAEKSIR